jgi:hypothetical protein
MFEPEYWTVCINGNRKEVRTVGMSTRLSIINTSARTGILEPSLQEFKSIFPFQDRLQASLFFRD